MSARIPVFPAGGEPRLCLPLTTGWRFCRGEAPGAEPGCDDSGWEPVTLPHCPNAEDTFIPRRGYYRGPGWYRRRFRLQGLPAGGRVHLVLEGSGPVTEAWLGGEPLGRSVDGYTGLEVELTQALAPGENVLAVRVDNSHDPDVLPGREYPDYDVYGGIYREAFLVVTGPVRLPRGGLLVRTPQVSADSASVQVRVRLHAAQATEAQVRVRISDPDGRPVAEAESVTTLPQGDHELELKLPPLPSPRLWSPACPQLYRAAAEVSAAGRPSDRVETAFGLRWFHFDRDQGFFLNGEHLRLVGVNRHQDYAGLGHALPPRLQQADAQLIKDLGGNFVRASHYPQHPAFLDACDALGICVYQEIASWQFIGGPRFADHAEAMMRAMIRRDANHPSLILWGLLNEGRDRALFVRLNDAAHQEDPSRPTIYAENSPEKGLPLGTVGVPDVLGLNYNLEILAQLRAQLCELKLLCSEHTNATTHYPQRYGWQAERISHELDLLEAEPWLAGWALWSMHDYGTDYEPSWPLQRSGVLDAWRRPKEAFHLLCARWRPEPLVHLEGHWNPVPGQPVRTVRVYTSCDRVRLSLDGRDLGERTQGWIRTWEVPYAPGCLEAVGSRDGQEVRHRVATHGPPASLRLEASAPRLTGPGDACWLSALLFDAQGRPVLSGHYQVGFAAQGPLRLRGLGGMPQAETTLGEARMAVTAEARGAGELCAFLGPLRSPPVTLRVGGKRA